MTAETRYDHTQQLVVHLEDSRTRRREAAEFVAQGSVAIEVLASALDDYQRQLVGGYTVVNALIGLVLLIDVARGARAMMRHHDVAATGVNVIGVIGGVAAIVEGMRKLQAAGFDPHARHFPIGIATILTGLLNIHLALNMARREAARALRINGSGVSMRLNRLRRFKVAWESLRELRLDDSAARLVCSDGRTRVVPLSKLVNAAEVREVLRSAFEARGIPIRGAGRPIPPLGTHGGAAQPV